MRKLCALILSIAFSTSPAQAGPYTDLGRAVVQIHVYGTLKVPEAGKTDFEDYGTGFVVSPDGLVLTAGHMAPDPDRFVADELWIEGRLPNLSSGAMVVAGEGLRMQVVAAARTPHDVALMRIEGFAGELPFLRLCDGYSIEDQLLVLGYSGGKSTLSRTQGSIKTPAYGGLPLVMQMPLSPGDSGGPVFNPGGGVFAIAIGQERANLERLEATTLAEVMPIAMVQLSPAAMALAGISYESDCTKPLPADSTLHPFHEVKNDQIVLNAAPWNDVSVVQNFSAPNGFRFVRVVATQSTSYAPFANIETGSAAIAPDGKSIKVTIKARSGLAHGIPLPTSAIPVRTEIDAVLQSVLPRALSVGSNPEMEVRTFTVSRTQDTHAVVEKTRKSYTDKVVVPEGFKFVEVVSVTYQSLNHSPSNGASVNVASDGSELDVTYELESGPLWDQWRGWIDAVIVAKLKPIGS